MSEIKKQNKILQNMKEIAKRFIHWLSARIKKATAIEYVHFGYIMMGLSVLVIVLVNPQITYSETDYSNSIISKEPVLTTLRVYESHFDSFPKTTQTNTIRSNGIKYLYSQATDGELGFVYSEYELTKDLLGNILTREQISQPITQEPQDVEYQRGSKVKVGAYFYVKYSRFGVDCVGCSGEKTGIGNFASGIHYEKDKGVRQYDGSYNNSITYEGYYIIAADRWLPLCTVLEIENHRFEGAGIKNNVPFKVIVLDRGGAIKGNRIDLFIGMQTDMEIGYGRWKGSKKTKATIIKFGKWTRNSKGQYACKL